MTNENVTRYVRYTDASGTFYGILEGETIHQLQGDLFESPQRTGKTVPLAGARLEIPVDPERVQKVIGLTGQWPKRGKMTHPGMFGKFPTSLARNGDDVILPPECHHLHHEGEMVAVIGKKVPRFISVAEAPQYVFGVAVGNDVADGTWYSETDGLGGPSRLLGKAPDSWAPIGDQIVAGLNYNDLGLKARLNGVEAFSVRTSEMNNSVADTVAYLSEYVTLMPGDLIYMGTPNLPRDLLLMKDGDVVEIELEGVGVVRNRIVAMKEPALVLPEIPADQRQIMGPPPLPAQQPRA